MDGFSYNNIFDTKGIEYLIIIAFLLMIIPFWFFINKKPSITATIRHAAGVLSAGILRIPQGLFFNKNHTWAHLEKSGTAKVGLDDLLLHITGEVNLRTIKKQGEKIRKGELLAEIDHNGKLLRVFSPLSGEIADINTSLNETPALLNEDPYGEGWVCRIKPSEWVAETHSCYLAEEALEWSKRELERFRDFMSLTMKQYSPEASLLILQDGGELCDRPLSELPDEVWQEFQKTFLNQAG